MSTPKNTKPAAAAAAPAAPTIIRPESIKAPKSVTATSFVQLAENIFMGTDANQPELMILVYDRRALGALSQSEKMIFQAKAQWLPIPNGIDGEMITLHAMVRNPDAKKDGKRGKQYTPKG